MEELNKRYGNQAEFLAIYVREAHPVDGWRMESNDRVGISFAQPKAFDGRTSIAKQCSAKLEIDMPLVVDELNDKVGHLYSGMPDRLYVIDREGRVAYKSGRGPFGFKPREMEQSLNMLLLDQQRGPRTSSNGIPILGQEETWAKLPALEKGSQQPLPVWARALARALPRTTAAMLELDYLQRVKSPLDPKLRGLMRLAAARANQCAYSEAYALADLKRAGLTDAKISAGDDSGLSSAERAALTFARKMTVAADTVTDAEVAQLMGQYGNDGVTAMVLLLAYANFQDRLILTLGLPVEEDGPLRPLELHFSRKPADWARSVAPARASPASLASSVSKLQTSDPEWQALDWQSLQKQMEGQRAREPRILVPTWQEVAKRLPPGIAARPVRIKWSLVCMGYQPQLAGAWGNCMRTFAEEAKQDRVFEESLFWVITRTLHCFY